MADKTAIAEALEREVGKLIRRHSKSTAASAQNQKKYHKRSGQPAKPPTSLVPPHWNLSPHFNPYHVRARIDSFSHALARKIRTSSYEPSPSLLLPIPKPGGGSREISISTVPDAAVAYWLGSRLIKRNSYRFSSYTYAYRADRNAHHAIEHLMAYIRGRPRLFVLEYDFAKYFDSIRHDYLYRTLDEHFLVSPRELHLLKKFLANSHAKSVPDYQAGTFMPRKVGIPQGSNISLFLANVACFELDREIEQIGVTFARYADDTLIVCDDYHKHSFPKHLTGEQDRAASHAVVDWHDNRRTRLEIAVQYSINHTRSEERLIGVDKNRGRGSRTDCIQACTHARAAPLFPSGIEHNFSPLAAELPFDCLGIIPGDQD